MVAAGWLGRPGRLAVGRSHQVGVAGLVVSAEAAGPAAQRRRIPDLGPKRVERAVNLRDAVQVYEGKVGSLRRFKDDVSEVQNGFECGVMVAGWNELKQGDVIEAYEVIEEAAKL